MGPIPGARKRGSFFLFPGVIIGKGYISFFWIRSMFTVNFNTEFIFATADPADPGNNENDESMDLVP